MDQKYLIPLAGLILTVFAGILGYIVSESSRITATEERLTAVESRLDDYQKTDTAHRERIERRLDQLSAKIDRDHEAVVGMAADLRYTAQMLKRMEERP